MAEVRFWGTENRENCNYEIVTNLKRTQSSLGRKKRRTRNEKKRTLKRRRKSSFSVGSRFSLSPPLNFPDFSPPPREKLLELGPARRRGGGRRLRLITGKAKTNPGGNYGRRKRKRRCCTLSIHLKFSSRSWGMKNYCLQFWVVKSGKHLSITKEIFPHLNT